jgi:hypothetical protein
MNFETLNYTQDKKLINAQCCAYLSNNGLSVWGFCLTVQAFALQEFGNIYTRC